MSNSLEARLLRGLPDTLHLEHEIPGGGMARVFLAEDRALGRKVVIKVLAPDLAEGLSSERFKREIQLAAQLQHPHLVPVLQAGEADGLPYYVMPFVAGESLRVRLGDGRPLPLREAVAILRDVARAMAYAHAAGIVHRDIKPDNVLLSGGSAMVSDFGIAKALSSSRATQGDGVLTRTGSSLGTPTYMAPEQAAADPAADHRVDLYAFGVMAYELCTGRPPFHDRPPQALLTAHLVETPRPLAQLVPGIPRRLAELVGQCLEKDPARRPPDAAALVEQLEEIEWSGERPATATTAGRRRVWLAAAVVLVLAGTGWAWRLRAGAGPAVNPALVTVVPFRIASADPALHYLREGMLDLLAAKLPGEGGLQATEPRALLEAWRAAGGTEAADLPSSQAHRLARRLGAGWLLLGDVVGTPSRVVLNASLFEVDGRTARTRVSVEGPPDSLGGLVDELVAKLLTSVSDGVQKGASLGTASLPVLRAYLEGLNQLRRGLPASVAAFSEALDHDSTFAPAALGLVQATGWFNDGAQTARGLRLAWAGRQRLNAKDQALLTATAGPRFPGISSTAESFVAARRYLQLAPERADAWYTYGDKLYHFGPALGFGDHAERAAEAFRRALAVDSTYVPGYIHLQQLAVELGDSALDTRLEQLRQNADTSGFWMVQQQWYRAVAAHDTAAEERLWTAQEPNESGLLYTMARAPLFTNGAGIASGLRAWDSLIAHSPNPGAAQSSHRGAAGLHLVAGHPAMALAHLRRGYEPDNTGLLTRLVADAVMEAGDTTLAAAAVTTLAPLATGSVPRDPGAAALQRSVMRVVALWRLTHGDTTAVGAMLGRLRAAAPVPSATEVPSLDAASVAALEALYADRAGRHDAGTLALRLDSLLARLNYADFNSTRFATNSLIAGRLLEKYGTPAQALTAVRRRPVWWANDAPYLASQLREEGRLAALAGDKAEAIRAYHHYLTLRSGAEPALQPELEQVRRELSRLEVGSDR